MIVMHHRRKPPGDIDLRYQTGDTPWDRGHPDDRLIATVADLMLSPCRVLEVGCGTGNDALWLAEQGFRVTAIDQSPAAIRRARERADQRDLEVKWVSGDFLTRATIGGPFQFAFDNGCFHTFDLASDRQAFAKTMRDHLAPDGLWLSLIASADAPARSSGPQPLSARDICAAVEPWFEIVRLEADNIGAGAVERPANWLALMGRREWVQRNG